MSDAVKQSEPSAGRLLWLAYGQIAALLGAFSLLVFLTHFWDVGLKGIIRDAFDVWTHNVRPVAGYPLHALVAVLPESWRFDVTDFWKDYLAVGLVTSLSLMRLLQQERAIASTANFIAFTAFTLAVIAPLWPLWVGAVIVITLFELSAGKMDWKENGRVLTWFAPLIYLAVLFAANALLV